MPPARHTPHPDYSKNPDYAIAALLQMLVRFPMVDCRTMADSIAAHLRLVAADARFPDVVRDAAGRSAAEWSAMVEMRTALGRQQQLRH
ncbi:MAG: hypothetical protein KF771_10335 [Burkholderiales bacterium]|nr:hypothetical protein [Burkholderiales bacterium]